ncbi:22719_t:CDS:1 [Cetraspora pellucida]|uniref:22719_t:CDS:1 n=1 Tax=Cetraspora pellucida TaxID=1433469 RepID=A0A9N9ACN0_9GLOM|nr:22719_t:CDS:1 [Cetraspora pellucida]
MTQSKLSENLDGPVPYYCGLRASDIGACLYKIRDDSVRPRHFLGADNVDEIEVILSDHEGHSLHEFIDEDEPLHPIIDFDLPQEIYDTIEPKLTRKEIQNLLIHAFAKVCKDISPN